MPDGREWQQASFGLESATEDVFIARINNDAFRTMEWTQGGTTHYRTVDIPSISGHHLTLPLPGRMAPVNLRIEMVLENKGVFTYSGKLENNPDSWFSLSWDGTNLLGAVHGPQATYLIRPVEKQTGYVSVTRLNPFKIPQDPDDSPPELSLDQPALTPLDNRSVAGTGHVKVLFLYAADVSYANLFANAIVANMNATLQRSGVASNNYISMAGLKYIPSTFNGQCKQQIIDAMGSRSGPFFSLNQDLTGSGADIALLLIKGKSTHDFCRVGGIAFPYKQDKPFAISGDSFALADKTAIHEIGHVMGGRHPSTSGWQRGYIDPNGNFQTVMGSYDGAVLSPAIPECVFNSDGTIPTSCPRIGYFSNPSVNYNGLVTGTPYNNMKYWLDDAGTMRTVSAWRENAPSPPSAPTLSVQSELCFGMHSASWTPQNNATHYRLFWATYSNTSMATEIYNGSNTSTFVDVPGTRYLWVKACNSYGCSPYSNRATATAINTCI